MGRSLFRFSLFISFCVVSLFTSQQALAGKVVKVNGKKVFILLDANETATTQKGQKLFLTTGEGKKKALVMVRNIKGNKVIAQLGKGQAQVGFLTTPAGDMLARRKKKVVEEQPLEASEIAQEEITAPKQTEELRFGLMGTFGTATQNVTDVADMSGSTMGFKALIDYSLFGDLGVQARIGMDMFSVTGSGTGGDYATDINYLTVDMLVRYYLMRSDSFGFFVNGGVGIYSPMSTDLGENQAIREDSISTTSLLILGAGISVPIGSMEFFLGAEYFYFPPSEDVTTSAISGKLGLLFNF